MQIQVHSTQAGRRFDKFIRMHLSGLPLSHLYKLIRSAKITCNGKKISIQYRIQDGDTITIPDSLNKYARQNEDLPQHTSHTPVHTILWQNEHILALQKSVATTIDKQFISSLRSYAHGDTQFAYHPHPVHQLDTNTSGLLLIARTLHAAQVFGNLFKEQKIKKRYISILEGNMHQAATWSNTIHRNDSQRISTLTAQMPNTKNQALTHVYPMRYNAKRHVSLVYFEPKTGKTHQIRAQAAHYGHPIVGDKKYTSQWSARYYMLHAKRYIIPTNDCTPEITIYAPFSEAQMKILEYFHFNTTI